MIDPLLALWLTVCAEHYQVEPAFARAVMLVESGGKASGPIDSKGRYYAPMGIAACFKKQYPIENPFVNIMLGVRALQNTDTTERKRKKLMRYNASFNMAYYNSIMKLYHQYKKRGY